MGEAHVDTAAWTRDVLGWLTDESIVKRVNADPQESAARTNRARLIVVELNNDTSKLE